MDLLEARESGDSIAPLGAPHSKSTFARWPRDLFIVLVFVQFWLVLLHLRLAQHNDPDVRVVGGAFDLTREATIPSTFSTMLAFLVAAAAGLAACRCRGDRNGRRLQRLGWLLLSVTFLAMGIDDGAALHERFNAVISLNLIEDFGYPSYPWHLVVAPWFALGILLGTVLLLKERRPALGQLLVWLAAVFCFVLAGALDFIEGWEVLSRSARTPTPENLAITMLTEECLEMLGTALFAYVTVRAALLLATTSENSALLSPVNPPAANPNILSGEKKGK